MIKDSGRTLLQLFKRVLDVKTQQEMLQEMGVPRFVCGVCNNWSTESRGGKSWSASSMVAVLTVELSVMALGKHLSFTPKPSDSHIAARQKHTQDCRL